MLLRLVLPLLAIVLGCLGVFGVRPFGIEYTDTQLIIVLLGVIAIDAFTERVGLLHSISSKLDTLLSRDAANAAGATGINFIRRIQQDKVSEIIRAAHATIWICGPSLDTIVQCQDDLRAQMEAGVEVKIVMVNPTESLIEWYGKHVIGNTYSFDTPLGRARAKERLQDNLDRLRSLAQESNGKCEVRILERIMWLGFIIVDAGRPSRRMDVQIYMYKTSVETAPILSFNKDSDEQWYRTFLDQYLMYWSEAQSLAAPGVR